MLTVDKESFDEEVIRSEIPVLVDIWGPACVYCLELMPHVEELAKKYRDRVRFAKLNSAENRRLCITLRVLGLPAFLAFKDGVEVKRIAGHDITLADIETMTKELITEETDIMERMVTDGY